MRALMIMTLSLLACGIGHAQVPCDQNTGPDVIVGDIPGVANYSSLDGIEAFSAASSLCNNGSAPLNFYGSPSNQHPIVAQNLFRLKSVAGSTRLEQVGMSWAFHTFFPLQTQVCCTGCQVPRDSQTLGVRCSDPESASRMGFQNALGPRWQVNAASGSFPAFSANPPYSGTIARRLQAHIDDINPALNAGAQYFLELVSIAPDDAATGNDNNNASYRRCTLSGFDQTWNMSLAATIVRGDPAVHAWQAADSQIQITIIDIPGDGRMLLGVRATNLGGGQWHYEYALENLNSDLSAQSFAVPLANSPVLSSIGFHDVDYHSGDGIGNVTTDGTDWSVAVDTDQIAWSTETFARNPNANALRWATMYNFRFDANRPPVDGGVTIGTFKTPGSVSASSIIPKATCAADIAPPQGNTVVNIDDLLEVILNWGAAGGAADVTRNGVVDIDDLLDVILAWGPCT